MFKAKADGIYIPAFNKSKKFLNLEKKNIIIIGSAHNQKEIQEKILQKCKAVFLSPAFYVEKSEKYLGIYKFNSLSRTRKISILALGGINEQLLLINPKLKYDSWLTIGLTNGDSKHTISSVGIDFNMWNNDKSLVVDDGAIFIMNPVSNFKKNDEIIVAQLTIPTNIKSQMIINVEGKTNYNILNSPIWRQNNIIFNLNKPKISTNVPTNCDIWFDGCNSCINLKNDPATCTDMKCDTKSVTKTGCLRYANGH